MKKMFNATFKYRLIYIFGIPGEQYNGLLKIGMATVHTDLPLEQLRENSSELNKAARERIKSYTNTAGINPQLLHTEIAVKTNTKGNVVAFSDKDVHSVLMRSGINRHTFEGTTANEWFEVDLNTAKNAITAVKENKGALHSSQITKDRTPILFREEQKNAIKMATSRFKSGSKAVLWNAKMRFGKTLSALQVVKEMQFKRTLIFTHRPVVDEGWYEDFDKIFYSITDKYVYSSKKMGNHLATLIDGDYNFVYFASIQDLRGSETVGGKFKKNDIIFKTDWDFIIIDEAHEGTQTERGQRVIDAFKSPNAKFLHLSGTPFNLLEKNEFAEDDIYTWDYVMEQRAKQDWSRNHYLDSNPYEELPTMNIYTYDLGDIVNDLRYIDVQDKAFNFTEFFRTWRGDPNEDHAHMPSSAKVGDFVHEDDIKSFLDLLCREDEKSLYPFSCEEYRNYIRHSLWIVPGVAAAAALSKMLKEHPVFQHFNIANVAGDGDIEDPHDTAMEKVNAALTSNPENTYSITLTVAAGRLTTGVTVKPWTAVLYMAGSYSTKASSYMQTIFRVQSPANIAGRIKDQCYVFDFAPDRTLNVLSQAAKITTKPGQTSEHERRQLGDFLNFCPVIGISGSRMEKFDTDKMLQQLKAAYVSRVVRNGFDDTRIYNDELLKLQEADLKELEEIQSIVKASKPTNKVGSVDINDQGLTGEEYKEKKKLEKKKKAELSEEEKKRLAELREKQKQKQNAITILRAISIRIPMMVYGANIPFDQEVTIENFTSLVDPESWDEFMPKGITKQKFNSIRRFYDPDIFTAAGRQIRNSAKDADTCMPTERVKRIVNIFATFKNPDKETVLTPWRVVNMQLSDTLGGYDFYDSTHNDMLDEPRFVNQGEVTTQTLANPDAHILEINSKSGLYPLYATYSIYRKKCDLAQAFLGEELTEDEHRRIWNKVVAENIFVICKTEMAMRITRRTLLGYNETAKANIRHFEDLLNQITEKIKRDRFIQKMHDGLTYWKANKERNMKIDAIIGNPPYQSSTNENGIQAVPLYDKFMDISKSIKPYYISMIMPARWYAGGMSLTDFRNRMLSDNCLEAIYDFPKSRDCFPSVDIAGGILYLLWNGRKDAPYCRVTSHYNNVITSDVRSLAEFDIFIRDNIGVQIIRKVQLLAQTYLDSIVYPISPFGLTTSVRGKKTPFDNSVCVVSSAGKSFISKDEIKTNRDIINKYKVWIGQLNPDRGGVNNARDGKVNVTTKICVSDPGEVTTASYLVLGAFSTQKEAYNYAAYIKTKFVRYLVSLTLSSMHLTRGNFIFVPTDDFSFEHTDISLYDKYGLTLEEINHIETMVREMN